jgi:hypothetical protein
MELQKHLEKELEFFSVRFFHFLPARLDFLVVVKSAYKPGQFQIGSMKVTLVEMELVMGLQKYLELFLVRSFHLLTGPLDFLVVWSAY